MRKIGILTTWLIIAATAGAAIMAWMSLDDIRRYLNIRSM